MSLRSVIFMIICIMIYYQSGYADSLAKELLGVAGIEIIQINSDNRGEGS